MVLLNAWFEACFSGPNKPLLAQWVVLFDDAGNWKLTSDLFGNSSSFPQWSISMAPND